jgi:hypothetical protein
MGITCHGNESTVASRNIGAMRRRRLYHGTGKKEEGGVR